jgi:transposase
MLNEIKLLVRAGRPKVLTVIDQILLLLFALFIGKRQRGFFAERRIG